MKVLGIDVGGSGIKAAIVDTENGSLLSERHRIPTPDSRMPVDILNAIATVVEHFNWQGLTGLCFPAAIKNNIVKTAANIDVSWIGVDLARAFKQKTNNDCFVINDADAAGIAELRFGAAKDNHKNVIIVITLGTGIGTALFNNGELVPNAELGHIEINGKIAERWTAAAVKKQKKLSWKKWGVRLNKYLHKLSFLLWPEQIIISGGISKKFDKFDKFIDLDIPVAQAKFLNNAGIIGASIYAAENFQKTLKINNKQN